MSFDVLDQRIVSHLRSRGIVSPTEPQRDALPLLLAGRNVLVIAPTGIGKTEAAMLPVFDSVLSNGGEGITCLYITPLRALNRDMLRRLEEMGHTLGISVGVRHGDTSPAERARQSRDPPQILITTPETLQVLFTGKRLREHLRNIRHVVVDEIHELAANERGAQLGVALERLVELSGEYQRIGLSATVGDQDWTRRYLEGRGRKAEVLSYKVTKEVVLNVEAPVTDGDDEKLAEELRADPDMVAMMRHAKGHIERSRSCLFFVNTREAAEVISARYHIWDDEFPLGVHHGSLSKEIRVDMEERFKSGELKALVCTSSLELGIDVGSTDMVIQYNSPRQASRLVQRIGRAGHRIDQVTRGSILATDPDELLESMVIARRAQEGDMEKEVARPAPLTVLANQLIAMSMNGSVRIDDVFSTITRASTFSGLDRSTLDRVIEQLASISLVYTDGEVYRRSRKGMKYFYDNISMIPDERTFLIRDIGTRGIVGTLDESFVMSFAEPFATFIAQGRSWRIVEIREDELLVERVGDIGSVPSWIGEDIPVPYGVALEVGRLRRTRDMSSYLGDANCKSAVMEYLDKQSAEGAMPSDTLMTVETGDKTVILNSCHGSKVNDTVGKILSVLLSARIGEGVGVTVDAYRIILELPTRLDTKVVMETLMSIKPEALDGLLRLVVRNSNILKRRFVYVAKKFGIVDRDADYRYMRIQRLMDVYEGSPAYEETMDKVLKEDMDLENTADFFRRLQSGELSMAAARIGPIGRAGIRSIKDLVQPARADRSILMALKKRLEEETLYLSCMSCKGQFRQGVASAPRRVECPTCNGRMLAALKGYEREKVDLLRLKEAKGAQRTELKRMMKNAELVREFGSKALMTLAGRGVGPDAAARILRGFHPDEDALLRDILAAEIEYARTKRFWD